MNKWVLLVFLVSSHEPKTDDAIVWTISNSETECWASFTELSHTLFRDHRIISKCKTIKEALDEYELHWL